jgi:hypothetical protein
VSPEVAYLRARYDEEAEYAHRTAAEELDYLPTIQCQCGRRIHLGAPPRQLADVEAKRKILDLHDAWPVLLETPPVVEVQPHEPGEQWVAHFTQQIDWVTTQQYRNRFGYDPPTSPIIRALLQPYADRDDFDRSWSL